MGSIRTNNSVATSCASGGVTAMATPIGVPSLCAMLNAREMPAKPITVAQ